MTTDLRELMTERADRLDPPVVDVSAIMTAAHGRVRRRRYAAAVGAAALAAAVVVALPGVLAGAGGDDDLVAAAPADPEDPVAWVRGTVLHLSPDGPTVDLGARGTAPVSLVQGTSGFVFAEADGSVHAVLDGDVLEVGVLEAPEAARFESDGDVVAWVDADEGDPAYAAIDLAQGTGVTRLPVTDGTATPLEREVDMTASVAAVDGRTVYLRTADGVTAWEPFSGDDRLVPLTGAPGTRVVVEDVKNGVFHYQRTGGTPADKEEAYVVGPDLATGVEVESWDGILSPDGRHLISETADVNIVSDAVTGERLPFDIGDYAFLAGYRWLDDDTYAALAMKGLRDEVVDLVRCEVATGRCQPVVTGEDLVGDTALVLPRGESW